ncbi:hypothetical protein RirG_010330 [Rhizophagus irregularis DAOM 197198w]|uniref:Uncharacterized protein n=1 Tax=Rhizophagus irregularis (strain DAOM 197198w) TaxID=1432141 RepID=A0A015KAY1_RHIIW|nr:hypothetical protein RirG_010330 [Rhizophagus irregularis DAOM 197198w]
MELQDQKHFLIRMQITLADKITEMEPNALGRPTTVNVMASMKEGKIVKFMFGTSVRCGIATRTITKGMVYRNNQLIAKSRAANIPILLWCRKNIVLTEKELKTCDYPWGNCAEWAPLQAMHERKKSQKHHAILWSQTYNIKDNFL